MDVEQYIEENFVGREKALVKKLYEDILYPFLSDVIKLKYELQAVKQELPSRIKEVNSLDVTKKGMVLVDYYGQWCTPPDALIHTTQRMKKIKDVTKGDVLIHGGVVYKTYKRRFDGNLVVIRGTGLLPLRVTPEHPILVSDIYYKHIKNSPSAYSRMFSKPYFVNAKNLIPFYSKKNSDKKAVDKFGHALLIPLIKGEIEEQNLDLLKYSKLDTSRETRHGYPAKLVLSTDTAYLLGLYVADGSSYDKKSSAIEIALSKNDDADRVMEILEDMGYSPYILQRRNNMNVIRVQSQKLARAFKDWCGENAKTKRVPYFIIMNKNNKIIKSFLYGYLDGDGWYIKNNDIWYTDTVSKQLALQIQLLTFKLGGICKIYKIRNEDRMVNNRLIIGGDIYRMQIKFNPSKSSRIKVTDEYVYSPIKAIEQEEYHGYVYNLETKKNVYCLSNTIVHNCIPCYQFLPSIEKVAKEFVDEVTFVKIDIDKNPEIAEELGIQSIPLLVLYKDGKEVQRIEGCPRDEKKREDLVRWMIRRAMVSDEEWEKTFNIMKKVAEAKGWHFNPNQMVRDGLITALTWNKKTYGHYYCPCKPEHTNQNKCPCKPYNNYLGSDEAVKRDGICYCGLFVSDEYLDEIIKRNKEG